MTARSRSSYRMTPVSGPIHARVRPPGSKSYTNRALLLAALSRGESVLDGALYSDDTLYMAGALRDLGVRVAEERADTRFRVEGSAGRIARERASVYIGNAGTAARFLPPMMALGRGTYDLDGNEAMRKRPIQPLLDALGLLGGNAASLNGNGCPPIRVTASGLEGGTVTLPGHISSQYFSALLMAGPCMKKGITLEVDGDLVSKPYILVTAQAMEAFGVRIRREEYRRFHVAPGEYLARRYHIEPDASAASYFFAAAAITGGSAVVPGLGRKSLQGDLGFVRILERMGCHVRQTDDETEVTGTGRLRGIDVNMADLSDTAQTLAAVAPFADGPTRVTGIGFIRKKETNRVSAVVTELTRLGIRAEEESDGFVIHPGTPTPAHVETYDDHRMAMSFALIGLRAPGIEILDPACTAKTFPDYFDVLEQAVRS